MIKVVKIDKNSDLKRRLTDIVYKNFVNLANENVVHDRDEISRILSSDKATNILIYYKNRIVAYVLSETIVIADGRLCTYIYYLYVSSKHRGKGYSKILLDAVIDHTKAQGVSYVILMTSKNNIRAKNLYKSRGFIADKTVYVDPNFTMLTLNL